MKVGMRVAARQRKTVFRVPKLEVDECVVVALGFTSVSGSFGGAKSFQTSPSE